MLAYFKKSLYLCTNNQVKQLNKQEMGKTNNRVIVPTELMNKLVALADVVLGGGGDSDAAKETAQEARDYIDTYGCEYYKPTK